MPKKKKKEERTDQFGRPIGAEKTPEQIAKEKEWVKEQREKKEAGAQKTDLRTREKLRYEALMAGKTPKEAARYAGEIMRGESIERLKEREMQKRQEEILPVAEEAGVFEERPERVELMPTEEELKRRASAKRYTNAQIKQVKNFAESMGWDWNEYADKLGIGTEVLNDLIQNPETQRQIMLQEIQREELDKSLSASQKLGALLEPYLGDLKVFDIDVGGYADQWLQMPKKDVETIVEQIAELESSVSGMTDSASQGEIGNPAEVLRDIAQKEEDLAIYEARIKRLIIESTELRRNPEQVNLIEEKILSARETFFEAKQRAAEGALITPTDSQLYLKLQELRNES